MFNETTMNYRYWAEQNGVDAARPDATAQHVFLIKSPVDINEGTMIMVSSYETRAICINE